MIPTSGRRLGHQKEYPCTSSTRSVIGPRVRKGPVAWSSDSGEDGGVPSFVEGTIDVVVRPRSHVTVETSFDAPVPGGVSFALLGPLRLFSRFVSLATSHIPVGLPDSEILTPSPSLTSVVGVRTDPFRSERAPRGDPSLCVPGSSWGLGHHTLDESDLPSRLLRWR